MIISSSIPVAANGINSSFIQLSSIPLCMCITSVDGHLGRFYVLVIVNSASMNIEVHASF